MQQRIVQGLRRGRESGDTDTPRASLEMGGNTLKTSACLNLREQLTDER